MADGAGVRRVFSFGQFEVDVRSGELRRQGIRIKLQDQPFQVLCMLLERPGDVVTRGNTAAPVADTVVEFESNLNAAIKRLREALNGSADNPRFIETIPRRGYRFIIRRLSGCWRRNARSFNSRIAVSRQTRRQIRNILRRHYRRADRRSREVENLRVVSRTSAFQTKEGPKTFARSAPS
jgi:DNA-binding winged helix-turn-helix (wHTH) protein